MDLIVGNVEVKTTDNRGLSAEELSYLCVDKIVSISKDAPDPIRLQAEAFKESVEQIVLFYLKEAIKSDRTTLIAELEKQGQQEMANILRRM